MSDSSVNKSARALVAGSVCALLVTGAAYAACAPGMLSALAERLESVTTSTSVSLGWVSNLFNGGDASEEGADGAASGDTASGEVGSPSGLGARLATMALSTVAQADNSTKAAEAATTPGAPAESGSAGANAGTGSSSGDANAPSGGEDAGPSRPSAAEEEACHAYLVQMLGEINSYLSQVNAAVDTFNADASTASYATRRSDHTYVCTLTNNIFASFSRMPVHQYPQNSVWADQIENVMGAYNRLWRYCTALDDAWETNISYADPMEDPDAWMAPINGSGAQALSEFNYYYGRIAL